MKNAGLVLGIVVAAVLVILLLGSATMMGFGGFGMMGGYGGMHGGMMGRLGGPGFGFGLFGALVSLVFWALVAAGVVFLVVWLARSGGRTPAEPATHAAPLDVLKARYARGEITKEQYDSIKKDLE